MGACTAFIFSALIEFTIVNYLARRHRDCGGSGSRRRHSDLKSIIQFGNLAISECFSMFFSITNLAIYWPKTWKLFSKMNHAGSDGWKCRFWTDRFHFHLFLADSSWYIRDHSSTTSAKRWVGGVIKWQFLLIYSTIYADVGGWV